MKPLNNLIMEPNYNGRLLSVVVPVFNESQVIEAFYERTVAVLDKLDIDAELIFVNDGSTDDTFALLEQLHALNPRVCIIDLSRNFGKEIALTAGLDYASGDAVVVIDADLQDPPELIPELVEGWREGHDVVYAQRSRREGETRLKQATAHMFYRLMLWVSPVKIPKDTGDFRLLSRRAVEALRMLREKRRFMKGLFSWIGFPEKAVLYKRDPRFAGNTKWNYWKLWNFALEGITSFSEVPLKVATYLGLLVALGAFFSGLIIVTKTLLFGDPVVGYPSLMTTILFFSGVQLIFIGILGEYLARTFAEVKDRPLYLIQRYISASTTAHNEITSSNE